MQIIRRIKKDCALVLLSNKRIFVARKPHVTENEGALYECFSGDPTDKEWKATLCWEVIKGGKIE